MRLPYQIKGTVLVLGDDVTRTVHFPLPIKSVIAFDSELLVLMTVPTGKTYNNNIIAADWSGEIIWQIKQQGIETRSNPFVGLEKQDEHAVAHNWIGEQLKIEPKTGKILSSILVR